MWDLSLRSAQSCNNSKILQYVLNIHEKIKKNIKWTIEIFSSKRASLGQLFSCKEGAALELILFQKGNNIKKNFKSVSSILWAKLCPLKRIHCNSEPQYLHMWSNMHSGPSWCNQVKIWWCYSREKEREVAQSCLTLCDPMDCSLPGSSVQGILQARILEWVAISFSRGSSRPRFPTLQADTLLSEPPGKPRDAVGGWAFNPLWLVSL